MKELKAEDLIRIYSLKPHPEGGFYRETYKSAARDGRGRHFCTGIYFLLPKKATSRMHRLGSDEMWHHYGGGALIVGMIFPDGREERVVVGPDAGAGEVQQFVVPAGTWFGAWPKPGAAFAFVGCTVSPGFEFSDFEFGERAFLLKEFPSSGKLIKLLT